ncbi:MAG TPA: glycosyltransferase [Solirubrobacterales bacterium]|nr:glycosyltransferase [Solirubrobacterales bacterium]
MSARSEDPIKVLVYADSRIFSGAESLLSEIVAGLAGEGRFELSLAVPPENTELAESLAAAAGPGPRIDVPSQKLPLAAFDLYDPRRVRAVGKVLSGVGADVMLLNLPSAEYGSTPLLARVRPRIPVVGLMHISGLMGDLDFRLGRLREKLARRAVSRLDTVCLLSEQAKKEYPGQWAPRGTSLEVIRMPTPQIEVVDRDEARRSLGLPADRTVIGMAGRMTIKQKGQDTLIEAAAVLCADRPDLHFAIAGDGQDRERVERLIGERGLRDRFTLLGQVSDMPGFLSAIDLIAIPSRFEGLPLIALEALAAGVPGVASSVDGICDVWPAEWRVEAGDAAGLADRLGRLLDAGASTQQDLVASGRSTMKQRTSSRASAGVAECLARTAGRD